MDWWVPALIATGVGVIGTGLGALLVVGIRHPGEKLPALMMGIAAGIMASIVALDMMPEAVRTGGWAAALPGFLLGVALMMLLHLLTPHEHADGHLDASQARRKKMLRTGALLLMGIALHNLPEGLAIGSGLAGDATLSMDNFGLRLSLLLMLHNIPEGVALAVPFKLAGRKWWRIFGFGVLAGLPTGVGAVIGHLLGGISEQVIGASIALGGGAMAFITLRELIPEALRLPEKHYGYAAIAGGLLIGGALVYLCA